MPLPEPQSALHQRLEKIADNIARLGQPRAEVIAFYMCGFKSNGNRESRKNNIVAQWLSDAQIGSVEAIAEMNAEAFLDLMMDTRPPPRPAPRAQDRRPRPAGDPRRGRRNPGGDRGAMMKVPNRLPLIRTK